MSQITIKTLTSVHIGSGETFQYGNDAWSGGKCISEAGNAPGTSGERDGAATADAKTHMH